MKKQRGRKLQTSRGNTCTESGVHHGRENKKDKEKPVKTTHPPGVTDGKTNVNKNNLNDIGNILCFYTNADQLRNKQN